MRPYRRRIVTASILVASLACLAACGSTSYTDDAGSGSGTATSGTTPSAPTSSAAPVSETLEPTTYSFTYAAEGISVRGTLRLSGPMRADDPTVASTWSSIVPSAPSSVSCAADGSDAVVVGSVTFAIPSYAGGNLAFSIQKPQVGESLDMEMDFSNQPVACCDGPQSFPINPTVEGAAWGPVPIAFTIPKAYGFDSLNQGIYNQAARGLWFREQTATDYSRLTYTAGQNMSSKGMLPDTLSFDLPGVH